MLLNASGTKTWEEISEDYLGTRMFWSFYNPEKTSSIIKNEGFEIIWSKILNIGNEEQFWLLAKNKK